MHFIIKYCTICFLCLITVGRSQQLSKAQLPYTQDFEDITFLPTGWEAFGSNTGAAWERSSTIGAYGASNGSAFFDNFTTNLSGNYYGMRAITLDLSTAVKPTLKFDVAYARKSPSNSDRLGIWYSFNGSTGWTNLMNYQDAALTTAPDQNTYFTPTSEQWDSITIDLTAFAGESLIRFAFENNCAFGNVMYIDNVRFYDAAFVGVSENNTTLVNIFPNPAANRMVQLTYPAQTEKITVFNSTGKQVHQAVLDRDGSQLLDLQHLPTGLYFLHFTRQNGESSPYKLVLH
jgi:hypothetical protein